MIRIDEPRSYKGFPNNPYPNVKWSHLWPDKFSKEQIAELHALIRKLGLKKTWFQNNPRFPHYDLTNRHYARAVMFGAVPSCLRCWIKNRGKRATPCKCSNLVRRNKYMVQIGDTPSDTVA